MTILARIQLEWPGFTLDVDLDLPGRGISALFGHSGSGKTTCLRVIAGLEHAAKGRVEINGETWQDDARQIFLPTHHRTIGYVFQDAVLFPHLSVRENLDYGWRRIAPEQRRVQSEAIIELLGIGALLNRLPDKLSGGEKSRVAIARALLTSPRLLLMDEPLAALDQNRKREILPYLEKLHDELDIPVLYVSHSQDEVARLADYLVVLKNGKSLASGPLGETLASLDPAIRLDEDAGMVIDARIVEHDAQWSLARVEFAGGTLWVRDSGLPAGHRTRVRILAHDVSLTLKKESDTSILNILPATIQAIADDAHPSFALIRLAIGETSLLAQVTRRSTAQLGLRPGMTVWAQIKAAALIR